MWINRHKNLFIAGVFTLFSVLLIIGAAVPIYQNTNMLLSKVKAKRAELDALSNKVLLLSKLDPNILAERVAVLNSALPPRKDVLLYLSAIDGLSRELGLTFGGLSLVPGDVSEATGSAKKTTLAPGVQSLETEIKMRGGQDSIYAFLRTIEEVLPLMEIKDIKVSVLSDDQYSLTLTLAMLWAEPETIDIKGQVSLFGEEEDRHFEQLLSYRKFVPIVSNSINSAIKLDLFEKPATILPQ